MGFYLTFRIILHDKWENYYGKNCVRNLENEELRSEISQCHAHRISNEI